MFVGALLAALGAALQAGAMHIAMLIVGRLIAGFSIGLMSTTIPIYCVSAVLSNNHSTHSTCSSAN
jgi:predicted MFS family arabinose efflux permease